MRGEILTALGATPRLMERMVRVFPADRLDDRPSHADLSPRMAIASLADNETLILERIRTANLRPGTAFEAINALERAKEFHYDEKDVFHEAEVYESRRMMTVDYLRELHDTDWSKTLILSGISVTIADYVGIVLANDIVHLDQISRHLATEVATLS
jgi:hypothetical protein